MAEEAFGGGAAEIEIFGKRVWVYSGSRIVNLPEESVMVMPPAFWRPGRPRYPQQIWADGRPPKTHDTMPGSR